MKFPIFSRTGILLFVFSMLLSLVGCGGGGGGGSSAAPSLAITSQPADQTVAAGGAARFSVVAPAAASYQWQSLDGTVWRNLAGASSAELSLANVSSADNGKQYRVMVTAAGEGAANIISSIATLSVSEAHQAPAVSVQPGNLTLTAGQNGAFSATATGTNLQYVWQSSADGSTWSDTGSPSNPNFTVVDAALANSGKLYRALIGNSLGSVTTNAVVLTVLPVPSTPTIAVQPNSVSVTVGLSATFSVQVSGNPAPALQWQSSPDGTNWTNITGATDGNYTIAIASTTDSGRFYRMVASNVSGTVATSPVQLAVAPANAAPVISAQGNTILRSTDGGQTWTRISVGLYGGLSHIAFSSPTTAVAVGNGILLTTDGGLTWTYPQDQPDAWGHHYGAVVFSSEGVGLILSQGSQTYASNGTPNPIARSAVLRSTDGGHSWKKDTDVPEDLTGAIHFADAHSPIALGARMKIFRGIGY
jgi:photosystem II stability/assembly factor-like uncharacterized protein